MSKFKYGDKVKYLDKEAIVVDCEIDEHYKIIPYGDYEWIYATEDLLQLVSDSTSLSSERIFRIHLGDYAFLKDVVGLGNAKDEVWAAVRHGYTNAWISEVT